MNTLHDPERQLEKRPRTITCAACTGDRFLGCICLSAERLVLRFRVEALRLLVAGTDPGRSSHARAESRRVARNRLRYLAELAEHMEVA